MRYMMFGGIFFLCICVASAAGGWCWYQYEHLVSENSLLRAENESLKTERDILVRQLTDSSGFRKSSASLTAPPSSAAQSPTSPLSAVGALMSSFQKGVNPSPSSKVNMADLVKGMLTSGGGGEQGGFGAIFDGPQGEQIKNASVNMMVDMQYAEFINGLAISPENKDKVRDILQRYHARLMESGLSTMKGNGGDMTDIGAAIAEADTTMRQELAEVLGKEGMTAFEKYQQELPERMLERGLDMQLGMFASGLSPESRDIVKGVLVEELLPTQSSDMAAAMTQNASDDFLAQQNEAFQRALDRLSTVLPQEEYNQVEGFVHQQSSMLEMVSAMSKEEGNTKTPAEKPAP